MGKAYLLSIGTSVPENEVSQKVYFDHLVNLNQDEKQKRLLKIIHERSGISKRYSVLSDFTNGENSNGIFSNNYKKKNKAGIGQRMEIFEANALNLSVKAVEDSLKSVPKFDKSEITHLITFSCTGMYAPGIDMGIIEKLDLNKSIERTCINFMGCYAAIIALKSAYHIIRSEPDATVLLVGVEICSLHYKESKDSEQIVANSIFGDGAAAVILSGEKQLNKTAEKAFKLESFYSLFSPASKKEMTWKIGDLSFELFLSSYIPKLLNEELGTLTNKLMKKSGISKSEISYYAIHPGGTAILKACEKALNLNRKQNSISYNILDNYGNMSSVTVLFVLKEIFQNVNSKDSGKNILSFAFGPGLTMESMILKIV